MIIFHLCVSVGCCISLCDNNLAMFSMVARPTKSQSMSKRRKTGEKTHKDNTVSSNEQHVHLPFDVLEDLKVNTNPKIEQT